MISLYEKILALSKSGEEGILVTVIEKEGSGPLPPGAKMLVYPDGQTAGTVGGGALERIAAQRAIDMLKEHQASHLQRYALSDHNEVIDDEATGMVCGGRVTLFYEVLVSGPRLYLFGGGHVGQALVRHLRSLSYYVTVIDHRPGIEQSLVGADRVLIGDYLETLTRDEVPAGSYFIIATASHELDYHILRHLFVSALQPRYVGLLASRNKSARFITDLKAELGPGLDLRVLYSPAGLDTGGSSVDEIAISVIGELQAIRYGREGQKHMRLTAGSIG